MEDMTCMLSSKCTSISEIVMLLINSWSSAHRIHLAAAAFASYLIFGILRHRKNSVHFHHVTHSCDHGSRCTIPQE